MISLAIFIGYFQFTVGFISNVKHMQTIKILNSVVTSETTKPDIPKWAGGGPVSDIVNTLIGIKPLYSFMKSSARNVLITTAEKKDVLWRERANYLETQQSTLQKLYNEVENKDTKYPSYYLNEFHAYDEGNLNWLAAYECEQATMSMCLRVWPEDKLAPVAASQRLRGSITSAIGAYKLTNKKSLELQIKNILDVGCSVGVSTFDLADKFPMSAVTGLDLSPYFLAVAKYRQLEAEKKLKPATNEFQVAPNVEACAGLNFKSDISRINWLHAAAEDTKLPSSSIDLINIGFVVHELTSIATADIITEMFRILSPGGMIAITDNNPQSPVIQNLPPVLFTLMKSTEPYSDQYYALDMEGLLRNAGFSDVKTVATDPRHRTILGRKI